MITPVSTECTFVCCNPTPTSDGGHKFSRNYFSKGSAATYLRCDGKFGNEFCAFITRSVRIIRVYIYTVVWHCELRYEYRDRCDACYIATLNVQGYSCREASSDSHLTNSPVYGTVCWAGPLEHRRKKRKNHTIRGTQKAKSGGSLVSCWIIKVKSTRGGNFTPTPTLYA